MCFMHNQGNDFFMYVILLGPLNLVELAAIALNILLILRQNKIMSFRDEEMASNF